MLGVEHAATADCSAEAIAERVMYRSLSAGLSYKVGGGNVATLFPPLVIERDTLREAVETFAAACGSASS